MVINYNLIVIGAGGTGSYFLKEISRFFCGNNALNRIRSMHIFDGDIVEEKNLARQAFTLDDVGRNKAGVMAEILNGAFDLIYQAHDCYLLDKSQLMEFCSCGSAYSVTVPLIISCVDNHAARLLLEDFFKEVDNCILFDSGNEFSTGEVVFSYKMKGKVIGGVRSDYFPDVKKGDLRDRSEMSCEELNRVTPQHIFTNMMAGNLLCSGVANLLSDKITPGFAYFNSLSYEIGFKEAAGVSSMLSIGA
jgi:hypothetical protein